MTKQASRPLAAFLAVPAATACLACAVFAQTAAEPPAIAERLMAEDRYRSLMSAGDYAAALPYAHRIVELVGAGAVAEPLLATAYSALGATQLRLNDLAGARASYERSLEITESHFGIAAPQLVEPLAGLGATFVAMDDHESANGFLEQAIGVSRRAEGLFNLRQLALMEGLAASRQALGDDLGVLAVRIHAVTILQQNFGELDPRTLPAVTQLAELYESMEEYGFARRAFAQVYRVSSQEGGAGNPDMIDALLGIARNHRLQYTRAPKSLLEAALYRDPLSGQTVPLMSIEPFQGPKLNREGRKAIEEALAVLRATESPPPQSLAAALIEMGDWYIADGKTSRALPSYAEAWHVHEDLLPEVVNPLSQPRLVYYRVPTASRRQPELTPGVTIATRTSEFSLDVDGTGKPRDVRLESTTVSEVQAGYLREAIESARYSPRFEFGSPVSTTRVRFTGEWDVIEP